ncbi:putative ABC transporter ATP-binding protein [compost metagenome]
MQNKQNKLDKDMATLNAEKAELDAFLLLEEAYQEHNKARLAASLKRQGELSAQLEEMEMAWLELQEAMEALEG